MSLLRPSGDDVIVFLILVLSCLFLPAEVAGLPSRDHGGIEMGVSDDACDNGESNLEVDWDSTSDFEYECQPDESPIPPPEETTSEVSCLDNQDIPQPIHSCMSVPIKYLDLPPRGGPHRPLWPKYGEYEYVPPQRWVHSLEHGAVVFLYHPCADRNEIERLKKIARRCLRRHVITPSRTLSRDQPFALLTYGCKLTMSGVDEHEAVHFIKEHALNHLRASEFTVSEDGQYFFRLTKPAEIVTGSDFVDSKLCPRIAEEEEDTD